MFRVPHENISSPRPPVEPHPTPQRNDYRGRTLQYAPVTKKILLAYQKVTSATLMKPWDIAMIPGDEFSSAGFIAENYLNPAEAEKYLGQFGLTPDGYEYLKDGSKYLERQENAVFLDIMSGLPEELGSSFSPIQQSTPSDQEIVVCAQTHQTSSSSSDHPGDTPTPVTDRASGNPGSSFFTQDARSQTFAQHSASQVQSMHQPVPASGTQHITLGILIEYLNMMGRLNINDDADTACANFIKLKKLDPKAEIYFSPYGLTEEGEKLLKLLNFSESIDELPAQESEVFSELVATNPVQAQDEVTPTVFFGQQQLASNSLSSRDLLEIRNTVCAIAYNIWGWPEIELNEFCKVNKVEVRSLQKRLTRHGAWSSTNRAKKTIFKLYGEISYGRLKESVSNALENADKNEYISLAGKVEVDKLDALLCDVCPLGTKSHASTEGPQPSTSGAGPSARFN